jgi:hypothetical protein
MNINWRDPHFWIGLFIFTATAISSGTIHLTGMIPGDYVPIANSWASAFSVIGTGYLTAALGLHNASPQAKIAEAAALTEVKGIVTTQAIATAAPSDKVVAAAADIPPPVVEVKAAQPKAG